MKLIRTTAVMVVALLALGFTNTTVAQVCLTNWETKVPVSVTNSGASELTDYEMKLTIDTSTPIAAGLMESDGRDIRFTAEGCCDQLCYYIESGINTTSTVIWVNVPALPAGESTTIYLFYGNDEALAASNGDCTFAIWDHFDDGISDFEYLCGGFSDSTTTDSDLNLSWPSNGLFGSLDALPFDEVYTAEAMVNDATGNWPGIYWAKETSQKSYGMLASGSDARISVTGGGTEWCAGHNWASPVIGYTDNSGLWTLTWRATGDLFGDFPSIGEITSTDGLYAKDENLRLMMGSISSGLGTMNIDWIRARKYAAVEPTFVVEAPVAFSPAPAVDLVATASDCEEVTLDAGSDYLLYLWSTGGIDQTESVTETGTYYVSVLVADDEECISTDSTEVTIAPSYALAETVTICPGSSYTYPDGTVATDIVETESHISELTTATFGCDSVITTTIELYEISLELDLGADITSCDESTTLDAGDGFDSYMWSTGSDEQTILVSDGGIYSVSVIDDNGCEQTEEVAVSFVAIDLTVTELDIITIQSNQDGATYQWLDCADDFAAIDGATEQIYTAITDGNYAVQITLDGCVDTTECFNIIGGSIAENETTFFDVYPNPTTGQVTLTSEGVSGELIITVTTVDGKVLTRIRQQGGQSIPLELDGTAGVYFIEVSSEKGNETLRVVKE